MTDETTTEDVETVETPEQVVPEAPDAPELQHEPDEDKSLAREAAKYRRERNEATASLTAAREHVTELQAEVVRLMLQGQLVNTADFDTFIGISAVLGEDGKIDPEKVTAAVAELVQERPYLAPQKLMPRTRPKPDPGVPMDGTAPARPKSLADQFGGGAATMADLLQRDGEHARNVRAKSSRARIELHQENSGQ
ncbi:hypothetical protein [Clavibacter michiganensis]|uniref:Scaffolding protein n=1 Tax=Clavibacter michiganensis TaxID=28447 RepID=A0A251YMP6_9MICO|nr:hypothetical protein [Clavibacter michiganensis]OUE25512.1 hypothetical protein BFL37_05875 [Clavibacter michiganensis]